MVHFCRFSLEVLSWIHVCLQNCLKSLCHRFKPNLQFQHNSKGLYWNWNLLTQRYFFCCMSWLYGYLSYCCPYELKLLRLFSDNWHQVIFCPRNCLSLDISFISTTMNISVNHFWNILMSGSNNNARFDITCHHILINFPFWADN